LIIKLYDQFIVIWIDLIFQKKKNKLKKIKEIQKKKNLLEKIRKWDDPVLSEKCHSVEDFKVEAKEIVKQLTDVLLATKNGIGLASPQIGITKNIFVIKYDDIVKEYINPEITNYSDEKITFKEGCLSYPNKYYNIQRSKKIEIQYYDLQSVKHYDTMHGTEAVVFQHEYDHIFGICKVKEEWEKEKKEK